MSARFPEQMNPTAEQTTETLPPVNLNEQEIGLLADIRLAKELLAELSMDKAKLDLHDEVVGLLREVRQTYGRFLEDFSNDHSLSLTLNLMKAVLAKLVPTTIEPTENLEL